MLIGNIDYFFIENKEICDGSDPTVIENRECLIPMSTFWDGPFFREQGEIIEATIIAENSRGRSEQSDYNTVGARVETKPLKMDPPSAQAASTTDGRLSVRITWDGIR